MTRQKVCGTKKQGQEEDAPVKRMPDNSRAATATQTPDNQKRLSIEVPEPPPILADANYFSDEPDDSGGLKRRTTDSEMDKTI